MTLEALAVDGIGEVTAGTDLARLVADHVELLDGDVVVVTSKIVSKALGLATPEPRDDVVERCTDRDVARRGPVRIVRTRSGLTLAAAGVDASNLEAGLALPLPDEPDREARLLRRGLLELTGRDVGVVVSDTAGRAWRVGQTDIAIGCAGLVPSESFAGREDTHGNPLAVTAPAVADEVASVAELASGKLGGRPVVRVRGLAPHLLLAEDGPGAAALVRPEQDDLFGLGSRDAVLAAMHGGAPRGFPADPGTQVGTLLQLARPGDLVTTEDDRRVRIHADPQRPATLVEAGALRQRLVAVAAAHGVDLDVVVDLG